MAEFEDRNGYLRLDVAHEQLTVGAEPGVRDTERACELNAESIRGGDRIEDRHLHRPIRGETNLHHAPRITRTLRSQALDLRRPRR